MQQDHDLDTIYEFIWGSSPTYVPMCPNPLVKQGVECKNFGWRKKIPKNNSANLVSNK